MKDKNDTLSVRQLSIIAALEREKKVTVQNLAKHFDVSSVSIRNDLKFLEERELLKRVHGAAVLNNPDDLDFRIQLNYREKCGIARRALELIEPQDTIFIESGSTNALLATLAARKEGVTVITSNLHIASGLRESDGNVIVIGGVYQRSSESVVGLLARVCLRNVHFSKAFIGIDGFSPSSGFTINDMMRADISKEIIKQSPVTYVLSDSSKFMRIGSTPIGRADSVKGVVTDDNIPDEAKRSLEAAGVEVLTVPAVRD